MLESLPDPGHIARRQGQVQPALPDRCVARASLQAVVEPSPGLGELAGADGEVGSTQPDPVVVRRVLGGLLQGRPDLLDRYGDDRVEIRQLPEQAEPVGVAVPAVLDHGPQLIEPPLELEQGDQRLARLDGVLTRGPEGHGEQLLGRGEPVALEQEPDAEHGRVAGERRVGRHPRPGRLGGVGATEGLLAGPEQELRLPLSGPPRRRLGEQSPRVGRRSGVDPRLGLLDARPIAPVVDSARRAPCGEHQGDAQQHHEPTPTHSTLPMDPGQASIEVQTACLPTVKVAWTGRRRQVWPASPRHASRRFRNTVEPAMERCLVDVPFAVALRSKPLIYRSCHREPGPTSASTGG